MNSESGRSLVEMLGTLAIMGILSMAGIWAYNTAMDKLKANTIINEAQKRAVVIAGQIGLMGSTHPTLGEFKENTFGGGTFSTNVTTEGLYKQFGIKVENVSKRICQNILNSIDDGTPIRRLAYINSPTSTIATCADTNTFLIVYNDSLSSSDHDTEYTNNGCNCQTVCGQCAIENGVPKCGGECPTAGNTCSTHQDCHGDCVGCVKEENQPTGTCQACQRAEYLQSDGHQMIKTNIAFDFAKDFTGDMHVYFPSSDTYSRWYFFGDYQATSGINLEFMKNRDAVRLYIYASGLPIKDIYSNALTGYKDQKLSYHFEYQSADQNYIASMQGASVSSTFRLSSGISTHKLAFFQDYRASDSIFGSMRIYDVQMRQNGRPVGDFVPVYAPFQPIGKRNCLYDKISKELFCNTRPYADFTTNLSGS